MQTTFQQIFLNNLWKSKESRSGRGAEIANTVNVRTMLPEAIRYLGVKSFLDVSCGDYNWMKLVDLGIPYMGCDIVPEIIAKNKTLYEDDKHHFFQADFTTQSLPQVELIMCRCTLYHLSYANIAKALANFKKSAKFVLLTNMPKVTANKDITDGGYRQLNLGLPPFNLKIAYFFIPDAPGTNEELTLYPTEYL